MPKNSISRRDFLAATTTTAALSACATRVNTARVVPGKISPNEKLNIAGVGIGGMGGGNLGTVRETENIVALCDIDTDYAGHIFEEYPKAAQYKDFREMLDKESKNIDGVIVATPDHTHAIITMAALRAGKHVFCQKPLAHSIYEVRKVTEEARKYNVQTQMGNQGRSAEHVRLLYEWIQDGAIGKVREVHAWSDRPAGGQPWSDFPIMARPEDTPPVPKSLDWDRWLGPAQYRPYHPIYHPLTWRGFWDFGTGALGDMGCHILDPSFWVLNLGHPISVQATTTHWEEDVAKETFPRASIIRYKFPARGNMPPVDLTWYDGRLKPPVPADFEPGRKLGDNGAIFLGDKGTIIHDSHGAQGLRIVPEAKMKEYKRPPKTLTRVQGGMGGHEMDWVRACKTGKPGCSSFDEGGPLTEMVLLGVLAMRAKDRKLEWDPEALRITNDEEANSLINPPYRKGWTL